MQAALIVTPRNRRGRLRRTTKPVGTPVQIEAGPTPERILHSRGSYVVGNSQQGSRIYTFLDTPLSRLYSRLVKAPKADIDQLRKEYTALQKYSHHWAQAGREVSLPSVDPGRTYASDPSNFSGMAKTEREYSHRVVCRQAREVLKVVYGDLLGHRYGIVLDNTMGGWELRDSGGMIGYRSPFRAREIAERALRSAGQAFVRHWGIG